MAARSRQAELLQLGVLLSLVAVFHFVVIPHGIADPEGFGLDEGLPPSFSARLVAVLAMALMLVRLVQLLWQPRAAADPDEAAGQDQEDDGAEPVSISGRSMGAVLMALLFAFVAVPLAGFLPAAWLLLSALLLVSGERRPLALLGQPLLVVLGVWLLFERLLSIRLPASAVLGS